MHKRSRICWQHSPISPSSGCCWFPQGSSMKWTLGALWPYLCPTTPCWNFMGCPTFHWRENCQQKPIVRNWVADEKCYIVGCVNISYCFFMWLTDLTTREPHHFWINSNSGQHSLTLSRAVCYTSCSVYMSYNMLWIDSARSSWKASLLSIAQKCEMTCVSLLLMQTIFSLLLTTGSNDHIDLPQFCTGEWCLNTDTQIEFHRNVCFSSGQF